MNIQILPEKWTLPCNMFPDIWYLALVQCHIRVIDQLGCWKQLCSLCRYGIFENKVPHTTLHHTVYTGSANLSGVELVHLVDACHQWLCNISHTSWWHWPSSPWQGHIPGSDVPPNVADGSPVAVVQGQWLTLLLAPADQWSIHEWN